jgi:hypothetical protein
MDPERSALSHFELFLKFCSELFNTPGLVSSLPASLLQANFCAA